MSIEDLQTLDQQAMLAEVNRLDDLSVIANLEAGDNVEEAISWMSSTGGSEKEAG